MKKGAGRVEIPCREAKKFALGQLKISGDNFLSETGLFEPCSGMGCKYDNHYQWTGEACQAGDTLHGATFDGCR